MKVDFDKLVKLIKDSGFEILSSGEDDADCGVFDVRIKVVKFTGDHQDRLEKYAEHCGFIFEGFIVGAYEEQVFVQIYFMVKADDDGDDDDFENDSEVFVDEKQLIREVFVGIYATMGLHIDNVDKLKQIDLLCVEGLKYTDGWNDED